VALGAETTTTTITKDVNNTGVNLQTETSQKQDCLTASANSGITNFLSIFLSENVEDSLLPLLFSGNALYNINMCNTICTRATTDVIFRGRPEGEMTRIKNQLYCSETP